MKKTKNLYTNEKWFDFSSKVKTRDGYSCLQCGRTKNEVVLQVHHENYIEGRAPWEYPLSDCRTLCKGCHARTHNLIEPNRGWFLISIDDLGSPDGICERNNCGNEIRYTYLTYHPNWGYMTVGSTCIEHLTQEDQLLSSDIIRHYENISKFVRKTEWKRGITKNLKKFISCTYKHHIIRIYGNDPNFAFQLAIKEKGIRRYDFGKSINLTNKNLNQVKELAYIALKGTICENKEEKKMLRKIYKDTK